MKVYLDFLKKGLNNIIYHKNLELLWECCQIPDFEKRLTGNMLISLIKYFSFYQQDKIEYQVHS